MTASSDSSSLNPSLSPNFASVTKANELSAMQNEMNSKLGRKGTNGTSAGKFLFAKFVVINGHLVLMFSFRCLLTAS